jgi:hypothetical protein
LIEYAGRDPALRHCFGLVTFLKFMWERLPAAKKRAPKTNDVRGWKPLPQAVCNLWNKMYSIRLETI